MLPIVKQHEKLCFQGKDVTTTEAKVCGHGIATPVHKLNKFTI